MTAPRTHVLLFDEDVARSRALARRLSSEAVALTLVHTLAALQHQLSDGTVAGIIACSNDTTDERAFFTHIGAEPGSPLVFRADSYTPLWELSDWLLQLDVSRGAEPGAKGFEQLLGNSPLMRDLREQIRRVAQFQDLSVLITGETGTGKDLVAQAIHHLTSPEAPFISVNCAAIPASLFEAELFGHAKGAFTGAEGRRIGLLEQAGAGTLFLDEVGELPLELQPKLLRSLETRRFRRLGSQREQPLLARVVSATHIDLLDAVHAFRSDLYFRLSGYVIHCPPLRARPGDVSLLAAHFLADFCRTHQLLPTQLTPPSVDLLCEHEFPGNVRELRGLIESLAMNSAGRAIEPIDVHMLLHPNVMAATTTPPSAPTRSIVTQALERRSLKPFTTSVARQLVGPERPFSSLQDLERHVILAAYSESQGCLSRMSKLLGVARSTLRDKLKRYAPAPVSKDVGSS